MTAKTGVQVKGVAVLTHGVMLAGMVYAMTGGHHTTRALAVAMGLVVLGLCLAPLARAAAGVRDHLLDLWVMIAVLVLPLMQASGCAASAMPGMAGMGACGVGPGGWAAVIALLAWAGLRVWSVRGHLVASPRTASVVEPITTGAVTAAGLLIMALA